MTTRAHKAKRTPEGRIKERHRVARYQAMLRIRDKAAVGHIQRLPTKDPASASARCQICKAEIVFEVEQFTGRLLRLNRTDRSLHAHQDG